MFDQIESKTMQKDKEGDPQRKTSKTLIEVKPVENISKNLQNLVEISPMQKFFFHINCKTMHMGTRIILN